MMRPSQFWLLGCISVISLVTVSDDKQISLYQVSTGTTLATIVAPHDISGGIDNGQRMTFSPDGTLLVVLQGFVRYFSIL